MQMAGASQLLVTGRPTLVRRSGSRMVMTCEPLGSKVEDKAQVSVTKGEILNPLAQSVRMRACLTPSRKAAIAP